MNLSHIMQIMSNIILTGGEHVFLSSDTGVLLMLVRKRCPCV